VQKQNKLEKEREKKKKKKRENKRLQYGKCGKKGTHKIFVREANEGIEGKKI